MDTITVKVADLLWKIREMTRAKMDYVTVTIMEADGEGEDYLPPCLHFEACKKEEAYLGVDFEDVAIVPTDEFDPSAVTMMSGGL